MKNLSLKLLLAVVTATSCNVTAYAQTGKEPIFHWVRQAPQDFDHFMKTRRNIGYQAVVQSSGETLLHYAARCQDSFSNVSKVISNGVNPNQASKSGYTPLMVAAGSYCHDSMSKLLNAGANPSLRTDDGYTALHYWAYGGNNKHLGFLIGSGVDIDQPDFFGRSAMHLAVQSLNVKAVQELIKASADVNLADKFGVTPMSLINSDVFLKYKKRDLKKRDKIIQALLEQSAVVGEEYSKTNYVKENYSKDLVAKQIEAKQKNAIVISPNSSSSSQTSGSFKPVPCMPTTYENLTDAEGAALSYALKREGKERYGDFTKRCFDKIIGKSKVPFRGNTLISYRVIYMYPEGHNAHCLKPKSRNGISTFDTSCVEVIHGKPKLPGTKEYEDGETEI